MNRLSQFLKSERLYILIIIFIILVNILASMPDGSIKKEHKKNKKAKVVESSLTSKVEMEKALSENKPIAIILGLVSLLLLALMMLGIIIDIVFSVNKLSGRAVWTSSSPPPIPKWDIWDVTRSMVLFAFFGYIIILTEAELLDMLPILKNGNFRALFNSMILDLLAIGLIMEFTVIKYKEKLGALGLSAKNFFKNAVHGIMGYIGTLPVLVAAMLVTVLIINVFKYVPPRQAVIEIFLKEDNAYFLTALSLFAAIIGPIVEELFFRGFVYSALKKHTGVIYACLISSAIFAFLHAHIIGFLPIMILGMLLAYLYERTGTLAASMTVHVIHNVGMVLLVFLVKQMKG